MKKKSPQAANESLKERKHFLLYPWHLINSDIFFSKSATRENAKGWVLLVRQKMIKMRSHLLQKMKGVDISSLQNCGYIVTLRG